MSDRIHQTALVAPTARLGEGTSVGPFAVIEDDVVIGADNHIAAHSVIKRGSRLGDGNTVFEHSIIGGEPQDIGFKGGDSRVELGDRNTVRESVTIHRSTQEGGVTRLGSNNFLMANVHIGHDCLLADHIVIAPASALGGFVEVEERAFISGGVMVHQFCHVGRNAMLGGNAKIIKDALPFVITDGTPARARGLNVVGLRRSGFSPGEIRDIKFAFRTLIRSGLPLKEALNRLRNEPSPWIAHLCEFLSRSRRSFHRGLRDDND